MGQLWAGEDWRHLDVPSGCCVGSSWRGWPGGRQGSKCHGGEGPGAEVFRPRQRSRGKACEGAAS